MADVQYPGLQMVENFLEKLEVDRIDIELELGIDQPEKAKKVKKIEEK